MCDLSHKYNAVGALQGRDCGAVCLLLAFDELHSNPHKQYNTMMKRGRSKSRQSIVGILVTAIAVVAIIGRR
jgi:hypothetical protein